MNPVAFSSDIFWGKDRMSVPLTFDRFLGAQRMNESIESLELSQSIFIN